MPLDPGVIPTVTTPPTTAVANSGTGWGDFFNGLLGAGQSYLTYVLDREKLKDTLNLQNRYGVTITPNGTIPNYYSGQQPGQGGTLAAQLGSIPPVFVFGAIVLAGLFALKKG